MKGQLNSRYLLFPPGFSIHYSTTLPIVVEELPVFVDHLLFNFLPSEIFEKDGIGDLKGIDPQYPLHKALNQQVRPIGEDLLYLRGRTCLEEIEELSLDTCHHTFDCALRTKFDSFVGNTGIKHRVSEHHDGALPNFITIRDVPYVLPIQLDYVRLGLELFHSSFISSMIGFSPSPTQSILIEADCRNLFITIRAEALKRKRDLPLQKFELLEKLNQILRDLFRFDLLADYSDRA